MILNFTMYMYLNQIGTNEYQNHFEFKTTKLIEQKKGKKKEKKINIIYILLLNMKT